MIAQAGFSINPPTEFLYFSITHVPPPVAQDDTAAS